MLWFYERLRCVYALQEGGEQSFVTSYLSYFLTRADTYNFHWVGWSHGFFLFFRCTTSLFLRRSNLFIEALTWDYTGDLLVFCYLFFRVRSECYCFVEIPAFFLMAKGWCYVGEKCGDSDVMVWWLWDFELSQLHMVLIYISTGMEKIMKYRLSNLKVISNYLMSHFYQFIFANTSIIIEKHFNEVWYDLLNKDHPIPLMHFLLKKLCEATAPKTVNQISFFFSSLFLEIFSFSPSKLF